MRKILCLFIAIACATPALAQELKLIPYPKQVEQGSGRVAVSATTRIVLAAKTAKADRIPAGMLAEEIERTTGKKPRIATGAAATGVIYLTRTAPKPGDDPLFKDEGYTITAKGNRITVEIGRAHV